jgi:hypothetical protein
MQQLGLLKSGADLGAKKGFDEFVDAVNTTHPPILFTLDFWYGHPLRKNKLFLV